MKDGQALNVVASAANASTAGNAAHQGKESVLQVLSHHLNDSGALIKLPTIQLGSLSIDLSITKLVVLMWVAAFLVILIGLLGRRIAKNPLARPSRVSGFVEVFVLFIRDEVVHEHMGHHGAKWTPYFISLFFFILISNLLGLFPGSATATGNIAVTAGLAVLSFLLIQLVGMISQGPFSYWKNIVPKGVPWPLWFIMWPIEFFGLFTKPFALTIRLFANMTAGHVVILVLLYLIFQFENIFIAPLSVMGAMAINLLEIFVCFIQAYIFVTLTALFVGSAMHRH